MEKMSLLKKYYNWPYRWLTKGMLWGFYMFCFMELVLPWLTDERLRTKGIGYVFLLWMIFGIGFEFIAQKISNKFLKKKE